MEKILRRYTKKFGNSYKIRGVSRNIQQLDDLKKLDDSMYDTCMNEIISKLEMHEDEEEQCREISQSH